MGVPKLGSESKAIKALRGLSHGPDGDLGFLGILQADPNQTGPIRRFIELAQGKDGLESHSAAFLASRAGTTISDIFFSYSRGIRALGHAEAVARLSESFSLRLGSAIDSLLNQAVTHEVPCSDCKGSGTIPNGKGPTPCWVCGGTKKTDVLPPMWEFAQQRIYELAGLVEPASKNGITIQQTNVQAKQAALAIPSSGFMEKVSSLSDELVHAQRKQLAPVPIEAQLVEPSPSVQLEDHREPIGADGSGSPEGIGESSLPPDAL